MMRMPFDDEVLSNAVEERMDHVHWTVIRAMDRKTNDVLRSSMDLIRLWATF
jgi:hypothetical protein